MWASAVVACVVVVSAGLLRRWPLLALAVLVAIPATASTLDAMRLGLGLLVLFYAAAGIEVCFIAATRSRRTSLVATLAGDALIAPSVTRRLIEQFARPASAPAAEPPSRPAQPPRELPGVTDREREVLTLVGRGLSNGEIAGRLVISTATAKAHVARLLAKLGARDRVQLVIVAYQAGLVSPSAGPQPPRQE